ncbi:MAG: phosphate ABC transporter permease subunit PstC [Acidimicrobiales bacterium]
MSDTGGPRGGASTLTIADLSGDVRRHRKEAVIKTSMFGTALVSVLISALIIFALFDEAFVFVREVDWGNTWGQIGWFPRRGIYDIPTILVATLIVTGIAMIIAAPLGLGAAIYLAEYANPRVRSILKPILEVLAGIPSVVLGFFALQFIAPTIIDNIGGSDSGSMAAAGLGVGILTIPLVASVSEDAMKAVPLSLREASAGLGARRMTTTVRIVLPAAASGLVAAFIVAVSRAIGETMVVFLAGGRSDASVYADGPFEPGLTMTAAMASLATGTDSVVGEGLTVQSLYFVGALLFIMTLTLNVVADRFVARVREQY